VRIAEEPFLTRESILNVLKPGELTTERPFRTLRQRGAASEGISVPARTLNGQLIGRLSLYSSLNADAARAYRLEDLDAARAFAEKAHQLEQSPWANLIRKAVAAIASAIPVDPLSPEAHPNLIRYLLLRRRSSWRGLEQTALVREWLAHSSAWLDSPTSELKQLKSAVEALDEEAQKIRSQIAPELAGAVSTFYGVVQRMDSTAAELEGENSEAILIPREDLERQGLASLGQAISLLREVMPGGGSYCLPMPAVALEESGVDEAPSPWADSSRGGITVDAISQRDGEWIQRSLSREPTAIPAAPLPRQ